MERANHTAFGSPIRGLDRNPAMAARLDERLEHPLLILGREDWHGEVVAGQEGSGFGKIA